MFPIFDFMHDLAVISRQGKSANKEQFNPDYAIAFVMSGVITKKSDYLETEA